MEVIVEIPPLAGLGADAGLNPAAAGEMNRADPVRIEPVEVSDRIETEVDAVGVHVMEVEQQIAAG